MSFGVALGIEGGSELDSVEMFLASWTISSMVNVAVEQMVSIAEEWEEEDCRPPVQDWQSKHGGYSGSTIKLTENETARVRQ